MTSIVSIASEIGMHRAALAHRAILYGVGIYKIKNVLYIRSIESYLLKIKPIRHNKIEIELYISIVENFVNNSNNSTIDIAKKLNTTPYKVSRFISKYFESGCFIIVPSKLNSYI